jgi:hypothetical protein
MVGKKNIFHRILSREVPGWNLSREYVLWFSSVQLSKNDSYEEREDITIRLHLKRTELRHKYLEDWRKIARVFK